MADRAPGGGAAVVDRAAERRAAAFAGFAGAAVAPEGGLVAARLAAHRPVVPQGRAAVGEAELERLAQPEQEGVRLAPGDRALRGVHAGEPQALVGVDVADT